MTMGGYERGPVRPLVFAARNYRDEMLRRAGTGAVGTAGPDRSGARPARRPANVVSIPRGEGGRRRAVAGRPSSPSAWLRGLGLGTLLVLAAVPLTWRVESLHPGSGAGLACVSFYGSKRPALLAAGTRVDPTRELASAVVELMLQSLPRRIAGTQVPGGDRALPPLFATPSVALDPGPGVDPASFARAPAVRLASTD